MLRKIAEIIEVYPWYIVIIILLITIGFGLLLPNLEMQTSMENFLPDNDVVKAEQRINYYFGAGYELMMIYIETENSDSVVSAEALNEVYKLTEKIKNYKEISDVISVAEFVNTICQLEFNKTLNNCTFEEVDIAFKDLFSSEDNRSIKIMENDDKNEKIEYYTLPMLSKGKSLDCLDIKNYYFRENDTQFCFSIEVYDLSSFNPKITTPYWKINVFEWYIDFRNQIKPYENMDMDYRISAHVEPSNILWEIGKKPIENIKSIMSQIKERKLFGSYDVFPILWVKPTSSDIYFPIKLETGEVKFNISENIIEIRLNREELGRYGFAFEMEGFGFPARLGDTQAGVRYFQIPGVRLPWLRFGFNISFIKSLTNNMINSPIIGTFTERIFNRYGDFSWEKINDFFNEIDKNDANTGAITIKDISNWWVIVDKSPDNNVISPSFLIKPAFMKDMRKNIEIFLSEPSENSDNIKSTLMLIQINGSLGLNELSDLSSEIIRTIENEDLKKNFVTMSATGYSVIESEINEITMDANGIVVPVIFIVISIILLISFRRISYVILPLLGLSIAIIWLFGTMVLFKMPFMVMEVALIPMLMGLGVDYSVHTFHNYRTELAKGMNPGEAIKSSIIDIGMAMFLATVTTFIAFLSFLSASMIPLRDFGVLCAIGIAYIFIITITFQAAVRFIIDRRKSVRSKIKPKKNPDDKYMKQIARIVCSHPLIILIITLIVSGGMIYGVFQIKTGFRMEDFLPEENESVIVMNKISDDFPFSSQEKEYILIEGNVDTVNVLRDMYRVNDNFRNDRYVLITPDGDPKSKSILSVIQGAMSNNVSIKEEYGLDEFGIPYSDSSVHRLYDYLYDHPKYSFDVKEILHRSNGRYDATVIHVNSNVMDSDSEDINTIMKTLYLDLNQDISGLFSDLEVIVTGENSMMYVIMNSMTESQIISTGICIILAAIVLIIAYRKPLLGLIAMIPVFLSTIWIVGTMHFIGYSLNVMTIMITSLTIGLGITYAIHAVERFRIVADKTGDVISAVSETIGHTGKALLIAAITTMFGFGLLILTPMPIEQQFGVITALTILYAFLTSLLILPPVLMFWGRWKKKTKGFIISPNKYDTENNKYR